MNEFLDPANRAEATIVCAAVALHGLLSSGVATGAETELIVKKAFALATAFLRQAEQVKG